MKRGLVYISLVILLFGCRKEICDEPTHPHEDRVDVAVDWSAMTDNQQEMRLVFYPVDGGAPQVRFVSRESSAITLGIGTYNVIVINEETELISFRGAEKFETFEAYMEPTTRQQFNIQYSSITRAPDRSSSVSSKSTKSTRRVTKATAGAAIGQPDLLFGYSAQGYVVTGNPATQQPLSVTPVQLVSTLEIVNKVDGMQNVSQAQGKLSGIASSLFLHNQQVDPNAVATALFKCEVAEQGIRTLINTFQVHQATEELRHVMSLDFLLVDGSIKSHSIDVSEHLADIGPGGGGNIEFELGVEIPDVEPGGGGGFDTDMGDWDDEITVPL